MYYIGFLSGYEDLTLTFFFFLISCTIPSSNLLLSYPGFNLILTQYLFLPKQHHSKQETWVTAASNQIHFRDI